MKVPIATAEQFALYGILMPINDLFILIYGLLEPITRHLIPEHTNFIASWISLAAWMTKLLSNVIFKTHINETLLNAFNDTLHTLSTNSTNFFGNISGSSGMSYIAKFSYIALQNSSNAAFAEEVSVNLIRAVNSTVIYIAKALEFV